MDNKIDANHKLKKNYILFNLLRKCGICLCAIIFYYNPYN